MTKPDNAELREKLFKTLEHNFTEDCETCQEEVEMVIALITSDKQRLLQELMEQKHTAGGIEPITGLRVDVDWLPLSVIQNKLEGLS